MKTKEELLQIYSAYLSNELKLGFEGDDLQHSLVGVDLSNEGLQLISPYGDYGRSEIDKPKPILYSMEMLLEDNFNFIWQNETDFESIEQFVSLDWESRLSCKFSYLFWDELLQWHFNVFGLEESEYIKKESLK